MTTIKNGMRVEWRSTGNRRPFVFFRGKVLDVPTTGPWLGKALVDDGSGMNPQGRGHQQAGGHRAAPSIFRGAWCVTVRRSWLQCLKVTCRSTLVGRRIGARAHVYTCKVCGHSWDYPLVPKDARLAPHDHQTAQPG